MIAYTILAIPTGSLIMAAIGQGVSRATLTPRRGSAARKLAAQIHPTGHHETDLLPELQEQLHDYFQGQRIRFRAHVDLTGLTGFQQRVLRACSEIPYGQTATYGQLARHVGRPRAARAVGATMARNPIPIIIPCHRVVAADSGLRGFSAEQGVALKRWLLALESKKTVPA